jgi:hypothetical protein
MVLSWENIGGENYDSVAFLWTNVTCQRCLIFKPKKITRKTNDILSNERKEILIWTYKELKRLRFNMPQMVAEMKRLNLVSQTGNEITVKNLEAFLRRNNLWLGNPVIHVFHVEQFLLIVATIIFILVKHIMKTLTRLGI